MSETAITVEGHFDHHHPAERGTVLVSAGFQGPDREPVVARTAQLHARLASEAERMRTEGAVTWWSADRLRVWSDRPWNKDGKQLPLVHHASVASEVKFADLSRLAAWVESTATLEGVTITGIRWALTEVTRARLTADAQHRAVQDAVSRASAYAQSLGLAAVRPVAIADPGMLGDESRPQSAASAAPMARAGAAAKESSGLDLKPEDITISARVHARFAAS
ncbi:SIMPL domain-containing protein [Cnuibacter sp. UC19_7]|uniref:SIMPL domain-containing protein n=1 Tax=Cnuibacter sp. UC19_7 TaxID=3350166 RepID=UPI00366DFD39